MILKRKRIKLGKQIRKATGIKLNEAISLAKRILKEESLCTIKYMYEDPNILDAVYCECCVPGYHNISGPKGKLYQDNIDKLVNELG